MVPSHTEEGSVGSTRHRTAVESPVADAAVSGPNLSATTMLLATHRVEEPEQAVPPLLATVVRV
jgi:hypothetical protein